MRILSEESLVISPDQLSRRTYRERIELTRSPGVHVQAVNKYLAVAANKLSGDSPFDPFTATNYPLLPALGVAWEDFRVSLFGEETLVWQPGEMQRDGISGNPDGLLTLPDGDICIWECKLTTAKIKRISECWLYLRQGIAYCALYGCAFRRVMYDVYWVLGDYSRPYQPMSTQTLVEFDEAEIETWWERMLAVKDKVKGE
jgi:hypothetical protein